MPALRLDLKVPASYEASAVKEIVLAICNQVNALSEGKISARYSATSVTPSGTVAAYAVSDLIFDSNATVRSSIYPGLPIDYIRLGWVWNVAGNPGTLQEVRIPMLTGSSVPSNVVMSSNGAGGFGFRTLTSSDVPGAINSLALITYDVTSGVDGGSSTGGSWQTRPLNTEVYDVNSIVTLSSNQFVLGTGTYEVSASGVFGGAAGTQIAFKHRIRNITDSTTAAVGASCRLHIPSGSSAGTEALVPLTRITLAAQKTFELQYFAQNGLATNGLGFPTSSAEVERYASVLIRKVA